MLYLLPPVFLLIALATLFYAPVVGYGFLKRKARWRVGRNYLAGMVFLLVLTGGIIYKLMLDRMLAMVARTADTRGGGTFGPGRKPERGLSGALRAAKRL